MKTTSIASIIGMVELGRPAGRFVNNATFQPFKVFAAVGADLFRAVLSVVALEPGAPKGK